MSKYTLEILQEAVSSSTSVAGVLRFLGLKQAGGNHAHLSQKIKNLKIDTSHFHGQAWSAGRKGISPTAVTDFISHYCIQLPQGSSRTARGYLKKALIQAGRPYLCAGNGCPNPEPIWAGEPLPLDIDHIDGDFLNNQLDNLRYLCPNCHRQTPTHSLRKHGIAVYYCECGGTKKKNSKRCAACIKSSQMV